jgi:hypothetical protein
MPALRGRHFPGIQRVPPLPSGNASKAIHWKRHVSAIVSRWSFIIVSSKSKLTQCAEEELRQGLRHQGQRLEALCL